MSIAMTLKMHLILLLGLQVLLARAIPMPQSSSASVTPTSGYWLGSIKQQGTVAFGNNPSYQIFRNVKDFGAQGDGVTDDTTAINLAISAGNRCGETCGSSTLTPALVYFPPGTYVVSKPLVQYYYTQMIGDPLSLPVLKAASDFQGIAVIDSDPYNNQGVNWYINQDNFFRSVRNFVIDLTAMPRSSGTGIHWQVAQATSLQNIRFEMVRGGGKNNKQQGIFMENGSGGFMSDLVFNGGYYGMWVGNQQFTTRNLTFNDCNTAIFVDWDWAWTFKSLQINNCRVGVDMSNSPSNQTVGSVLILDSIFSTTTAGVVTAFSPNSVPKEGGILILDNVDFTDSNVAVADPSGNIVLVGGAMVHNWVQGSVYSTSGLTAPNANPLNRRETVRVVEYEVVPVCPAVYSGTSSVPESQLSGTGLSTLQSTAEAPASISTGVSSTSLPSGSPNGFASSLTGSALSGFPTSFGVVSSASSMVGTANKPLASATARVSESSQATPPMATATCANEPLSQARIHTTLPFQAKPQSLLDLTGAFFARSRPLYESYPTSAFVSVKSAGAKGDGVTDDTAAIQKAMDSIRHDQILYFDHGAYIITSTVKVPSNIKMTGEVWPLLMASGSAFADQRNPIPMLQIGAPGDKGAVEMSDLILETKGPAPGAILMQWNVAEATQGSVGMWDIHFRLGGSAGTQMQSNACPKTPDVKTVPNSNCIAAFMSLHITETASAYIENSWLWTADHDLDLPGHAQIDIYTGRGMLVESHGPVWLYGTAVEHHQLYNYQLSSAQNVFMGLIQTETPYYQSNPNSLVPFHPQPAWNDPDFARCTTASCQKTWALRVQNSTEVWVYGAGLYSFFNNYDQSCLSTESCQENIVEVDCSQVHIYGLSTKASTNMITSSSGLGLIPQDENISTFCSTIALFEQSV